MIPAELVNRAVKSGVVFTCAMCKNFWRSQALGLEECRKLIPGPCAGPLKGLAYPYYDGDLKNCHHSVCFVCGSKADGVLKVKTGEMIGVCNKHKDALFDFSGEIDGRPDTADGLKVEEK